jgi:hypothetical protein
MGRDPTSSILAARVEDEMLRVENFPEAVDDLVFLFVEIMWRLHLKFPQNNDHTSFRANSDGGHIIELTSLQLYMDAQFKYSVAYLKFSDAAGKERVVRLARHVMWQQTVIPDCLGAARLEFVESTPGGAARERRQVFATKITDYFTSVLHQTIDVSERV